MKESQFGEPGGDAWSVKRSEREDRGCRAHPDASGCNRRRGSAKSSRAPRCKKPRMKPPITAGRPLDGRLAGSV
jgi:hypothetical protein